MLSGCEVKRIDLQAHFSDIRAVIAGELDAAAESVVAAVAWLTDPVLLEGLVKAARRGCRVQLALLDDAINRPSGAKLEQVRAAGGAVYREAVMRCHPDRVTEADQAVAQTIFVQVQRAYQQSDLDTLNRLHRHLTEGQPFPDPAQVWTEQDQVRGRISRLRLEVERRLAEIRALRASETYQTLAAQADWAGYFATVRQRLEQECAELRQKIVESGNG